MAFFNFYQAIYSLSAISLASLKLIAVVVFDISSFLGQNLQRTITKKMIFLLSPGNLLLILYKLSKFEAHSCNGF